MGFDNILGEEVEGSGENIEDTWDGEDIEDTWDAHERLTGR